MLAHILHMNLCVEKELEVEWESATRHVHHTTVDMQVGNTLLVICVTVRGMHSHTCMHKHATHVRANNVCACDESGQSLKLDHEHTSYYVVGEACTHRMGITSRGRSTRGQWGRERKVQCFQLTRSCTVLVARPNTSSGVRIVHASNASDSILPVALWFCAVAGGHTRERPLLLLNVCALWRGMQFKEPPSFIIYIYYL